ncbi:MAG: hypothetical protein HY807_03425 [Nitrospirae bacterium]|nr:hypothetical protein [Nitrospirota bacterium]
MMMRKLPVILIGTNSILLQIVCIRQLLSVFSGNELIIGITLAAWLILVSLGSYIGSNVKSKYAFVLSFILIASIAQPALFFIEIIRPILGYGLGEVIPLPAAIACIALSLSLLCIAIGAQFPLAVSYLKDKAPEAYSFEAIGAFIGAVIFTFLLAGHIDAYKIVLLTAIINIFISVFLLRKAILLPLLILPLLFYYVGGQALKPLQYKGFELVSKTESRYGEVTVLKTKGQFNLYSSEKFQFSYPDAQTEEMKAHIPMSVHPAARDVLIVGGSPAVIREFLKYPVTKIDFVEIDPVVIDVSKRFLSDDDLMYLKDEKVNLFNMDARLFIKSAERNQYDMIMLNIPEPATANLNRFYTVEFFKEAKAALKKEGLLYLSLPASFGYISNKMQMANGSVYKSLNEVFPHVEASSEEYGIIIASMSQVDVDPGLLIKRFEGADISTEHFRQYILQDAFSPLQVDMVKERLGKVYEINSDSRPVSCLYNMMLWADVHKGKWINLFLNMSEKQLSLFVSVVMALLTSVFIVRRQPVSYAIFTTGYFTMAFSIIIMLTFQSFFGYIYEMIGMLTGTFMLGGAAGAYVMRNVDRPEDWLKAYDSSALILLLLSIFILKNEAVFYMMLFTAGFIGGGQFAVASRSTFESANEGLAGRLYAVDLAGSFLGALLTAIFLIPLIGMQKAVFSLIVMKITSLIYLSVYKKA